MLSSEARKRIEKSCRKAGKETPWEYKARRDGIPSMSSPEPVRPAEQKQPRTLLGSLIGGLSDCIIGRSSWS
jgi:hypothetical protein